MDLPHFFLAFGIMFVVIGVLILWLAGCSHTWQDLGPVFHKGKIMAKRVCIRCGKPSIKEAS